MKLSTLKKHDEISEQRCQVDPEYADETDCLNLANTVSLAVVHYRAKKNLTQTAFAAMLGWKQPHVARLESGDVMPSINTLELLAHAGVLEFHIEPQRTFVRELVTA